MKKEYLILVVIIAALGMYLLLKKTDKTHYQLPELPELEMADLDMITIVKKDGTLKIKKRGDRWVIGEKAYPADERKMKELVQQIAGLKLITLASESKNYSIYDLDDENKITVKGFKGDKLLRGFEVGKAAPSYSHTFVRLLNDYRVYHAEKNFRYLFDLDMDQLRDKSVMKFSFDEIRSLTLESEGKSLTIVRTETDEKGKDGRKKRAYRTSDGKKADTLEVEEIIRTMSDLRCERYIEGKEKKDFTDPVYTVTAEGNRRYTISFYRKEKEDSSYPAVSSENDYPFLIQSWEAERIMKKFKDLVVESKPVDGSG